MDINAALEDIRDLIQSVKGMETNTLIADKDGALADIAAELASKVAAVDEWMKSGGFMPYTWETNR